MVSTRLSKSWFSDKRNLVLICVLALTVRVIWALLVPVEPVSDANMYHIFAQEIAAGRGYTYPDGRPTAYWPVGPAAFYAIFYALAGVNDMSVVVANLILSGALVIAIYRLGILYFDRRVAQLAALIFAIWPVWIQFTTILSSELPFVTLMAYAFVARREPHLPHWCRTLLSTALLVGAAYMRPTILPLIVLLPLLDEPFRKPTRMAMHTLLAVIVAAALLAPWAERNRALFGERVLISANFGANLWMGNNPISNGAYMPLPEINAADELSRDSYFKERAIEFIQENPLKFAQLCLRRVAHSFDRESIGIAWNEKAIEPALQPALKAISALYWLFVFLLSLAGVSHFLRRNPLRVFHPLIVAPVLFAAVAIIVVGQDRYHMPMMPFVALFASFFIINVVFSNKYSEESSPNTLG